MQSPCPPRSLPPPPLSVSITTFSPPSWAPKSHSHPGAESNGEQTRKPGPWVLAADIVQKPHRASWGGAHRWTNQLWPEDGMQYRAPAGAPSGDSAAKFPPGPGSHSQTPPVSLRPHHLAPQAPGLCPFLSSCILAGRVQPPAFVTVRLAPQPSSPAQRRRWPPAAHGQPRGCQRASPTASSLPGQHPRPFPIGGEFSLPSRWSHFDCCLHRRSLALCRLGMSMSRHPHHPHGLSHHLAWITATIT